MWRYQHVKLFWNRTAPEKRIDLHDDTKKMKNMSNFDLWSSSGVRRGIENNKRRRKKRRR